MLPDSSSSNPIVKINQINKQKPLNSYYFVPFKFTLEFSLLSCKTIWRTTAPQYYVFDFVQVRTRFLRIFLYLSNSVQNTFLLWKSFTLFTIFLGAYFGNGLLYGKALDIMFYVCFIYYPRVLVSNSNWNEPVWINRYRKTDVILFYSPYLHRLFNYLFARGRREEIVKGQSAVTEQNVTVHYVLKMALKYHFAGWSFIDWFFPPLATPRLRSIKIWSCCWEFACARASQFFVGNFLWPHCLWPRSGGLGSTW